MPKPLVSLLVAAGAGVATLATASAPAFAATAHHAQRAHTAHVRPSDRLRGPRNGAAHAIAAQIRLINAELASDTASTVLNSTDQAALISAVQSDLAAATADRAALPGATSLGQIRALVAAAGLSAHVAILQSSVVTAADTAETTVAGLSSTASTLSGDLSTASANGTDVTAGEAALTDLQTQLATAQSDAAAAVPVVLAVPATATRSQVQAATASAGQQLEAVTAAITAANADVTVIDGVLGL